MSTSRDEIIRILLQTGGIPEATKLRDELNDIVGASDRAAKSQVTFSQAINQSKVALAGAGIALAGVVRSFSAAAQASSQFQTAVAEVGTLLGDQSGIPQITEDLKGLAREFGGSVVDQAKAMYQIISAGAAEGAEANAILAASNKLAIGGLTSLTTAADGLTSVLNAYNLGATDATRVSDLFFTAVRDGKTTVDELSSTLGRVAPLASEAGVGIEELLAAIAALTKTGASTEQAVTAIRGALTGVVKPTSDAAKLAQELGLQFDAAALKSKGFAGFLGDVAAATAGNQAQLARLFGSVEGLNGVLALTGSQADSFANSLRNMESSAGAAQRAFEQIDDTPAQRLARFQAATEQVRIALGNAITAFAPIVEALGSVLNAFSSLPGPIQTVAAGLGGLALAAAPLAIALRALAPAVGILTAQLGAAGFVGAAGAAAGAAGLLRGALLLLGKAAIPLTLAAPFVALTSAILEARSAAQSLNETQEARVRQVEVEIEARQRLAASTRMFADEAVMAATQLAEISKRDLIDYNRRLEIARQYTDAQIGIVLRQEEISGRTAETSEQLRRATQRAAELRAGLTEVAAAIKASTDDLSPKFVSVEEAFKTLGVSAETAGAKITETGKVTLQAFDSIASTAETNSRQILESYTNALAKLATSAEVKQLAATLNDAFAAGRISTDEFIAKSAEAVAKLREISGESGAAGDELKKLGDKGEEGGDRAAKALRNAADAARGIGKEAEESGAKVESTSDKQEGAANALSGVLNGMRESLRQFGDEAVDAFDRAFAALAGSDNVLETSGRTYVQTLQLMANTAKAVATQFELAQAATDRKAIALERLSQNSAEAGQALAKLGFSAEDVRNGTVDASAALRALDSVRMDRVRGELQGVLGTLEGIDSTAAAAKDSLAAMNDEYEREQLRRAGNEAAIAEREYQDELRRIDELAAAGGAAAAQEAALARRLARENHEAALREIRERADAQKKAAREVQESVASGGAAAGGAGGGRGGGGAAGGRGGTQTIRVEFSGGGGMDIDPALARDPSAIRRLAEQILLEIRQAGGGSI